ncbi:transcriptional-activator LEC1, partial [Lasiosphaeria hispida]
SVLTIMRKALPNSGAQGPARIAQDAKECMQRCVGEFISFVTSEAAEMVAKDKRTTVTGEDILEAFETLGLGNYKRYSKSS